MDFRRQAIAGLASLLVVGFISILFWCVLWPPAPGTFRADVAKEAAKVSLQLLGLTAIGGLASELVRDARERKDFASRLRTAYGKAKRCRRRLRRLPAEKHDPELEMLEDIQLEFENLKEEAEWTYGGKSKIVTDLKAIEEYLHDVLDVRFPVQSDPATTPNAYQDFVAHYSKRSRFAADLKEPYHAIRHALR